MARVQGLSMFWFKMFSGSESISFRAVPLEKCFDFMWLNLLSPFPHMGWVVGSLACPCRKEGWVHQDLGSSDAHVLFPRGLEPSVTSWAFPVRAHLQPRWGSSSHQVVVQELSLILPVACNRTKMRRSWKSVLRPGFPQHAAEFTLLSLRVVRERFAHSETSCSRSLCWRSLLPPTHTHLLHPQNQRELWAFPQCPILWLKNHSFKMSLGENRLSWPSLKDSSSAAGLQGNCLGPHSNPPLSVSPTL